VFAGDPQRGISKRGSKYLRTLFIQAANVILMRSHNWERLSFGVWRSERSSTASSQQAGNGPGQQTGTGRVEHPAQRKDFRHQPSRGHGDLSQDFIQVRETENAWNGSMSASRVWWH
jgi:hypothetical protein